MIEEQLLLYHTGFCAWAQVPAEKVRQRGDRISPVDNAARNLYNVNQTNMEGRFSSCERAVCCHLNIL